MGLLNDLMNKHGTDKGDGNYDKHSYADFYEEMIGLVPTPGDRPFSLLEIGVWDPRNPGSSIRAWREFLPVARIIGVDINPDCKVLAEEQKVDIVIADQGSKDAMTKLGETYGIFDFIVDDGSHNLPDQVASLQALWPFLAKGGFYAIEDLHAPQSQPKEHLIVTAAAMGVTSGMWLSEKLLVFRKD